MGDGESKAKEALVIMAVGFKKFWKLPLAYFLLRGASSGFLAGVIRETIVKAQEAGVKVRTITMDGTVSNVSAFSKLGAKIHTKEVGGQVVSFPHPVDESSPIFVIMDPPHMIKLVRNALADYSIFAWPGVGKIEWRHLTELHRLQDKHGYRLGNRLGENHISYKRNKMKVKYAVQAIASDSVARSLKWAHENKIDGFTSPDVLATARFEEILDKLFDILNSRSPNSPEFKRSLTEENFHSAEEVFAQAEMMFAALEDGKGNKLIHSQRKTGPLGLLADIKSVRGLMEEIRSGSFNMFFLSTYKFSQDHLELFFNVIRTRNGWSYNPTPYEFRAALRALLIHAGQKFSGSLSANVVSQDDTTILTLSSNSLREEAKEEDINERSLGESLEEADVHIDGCGQVENCFVCLSTLTYLGGFISFSLAKIVKCLDCKKALVHSEEDKTTNDTLIKAKNYAGERDGIKTGLTFPSGSVCRILYQAEGLLRQTVRVALHDKQLREKILLACLQRINTSLLFPSLDFSHDLTTSNGISNHSLALIHLVLLKYIDLRLRKIVRDSAHEKKGNFMHRARIFSNV